MSKLRARGERAKTPFLVSYANLDTNWQKGRRPLIHFLSFAFIDADRYFSDVTMNAILRLGDYPPAERVTRLAIMLNALDDENVCLVLKRALQAVPLKILAGIYNTSVYQCTIGWR